MSKKNFNEWNEKISKNAKKEREKSWKNDIFEMSDSMVQWFFKKSYENQNFFFFRVSGNSPLGFMARIKTQ